ncbi:ISAs1 family transposase [soil metagenome]
MPSCLTAPVPDEHLPLSATVPVGVARSELTERDRESLLAALARVPDPRDPRGVRYPIVAMLTVVVCAMLAGARSYAAIGEWGADLNATRRAALGFTGRAPGPVTIWRLLVRIDAAALDEVVCVWTRAYLERVNEAARARVPDQRPVRRVLAVDGKAMRATLRGTNPMHLLCALDQASGVVVAQVSVDVKTNEIPLFATLLDQIPDLEGTLVTGDALHAQVGHLTYLHKRGADLLVCVKGNQPTLRKRLKDLPWADVPVGHTQTGRGHGRIEKRTVKVVTVEAGLGFPHATQGIQIVRRSRPITPGTAKRAKWRTETVYAICTLSAAQAQPRELARWLRDHWGIENRLHWVRDVTLGEDLHQARTGSGPHALAICRNLLISLLRLAGHTNIARALRHHARHPDQAIALVASEQPTTQ